MTGIQRHITTTVALLLLTCAMGGCRATLPRLERAAEAIPAQTCGGNVDSDGDGVSECLDRCAGTLPHTPVSPDGCPLPEPVMEAKPFRG